MAERLLAAEVLRRLSAGWRGSGEDARKNLNNTSTVTCYGMGFLVERRKRRLHLNIISSRTVSSLIKN
jgi:hypothetical protein